MILCIFMINPIKVASFFNCTHRTGHSTLLWPFSWLGQELFRLGSTDNLILLQIYSGVVWQFNDLQLSRNMVYLLSAFSKYLTVIYELFILVGWDRSSSSVAWSTGAHL